MSQILWNNNASTTIAGSIAFNSTSITVSAGTGSDFPSPANYQYFLATLSPSTPGAQPPEIVKVTSVSGDVFTVVRGQEGTPAQAWGSGAILQNLITDGTLSVFPQMVTYSGNPNGNVAGAAAAGGNPPSMLWDSSNGLVWICTVPGNAATATWAAQAPLNSPAFTGNPTAVTQSPGNNTTRLATTAFVQAGLALKADLAGSASQLFSVASAVSNSNAVNLGQFGNRSLTANGYQVFPGGLILQWASGPIDPPNISEPAYAINWPIAFPAACYAAFVSMNIGFANIGTDHWYQTAGFNTTSVTVQRQTSGQSAYGAPTQAFVIGIGA
jgi:hypothetical protein